MITYTVRLTSVLLLSVWITDVCSQGEAVSGVGQLNDTDQEACLNYLTANYSTPEDYVVKKFQDHDIIFVGESHHVKQNLGFLQRLIPTLHKNGVYYLGYEFAKYEDQGMIDRLITAREYDEKMAFKIVTNKSEGMGTQEYVDVFRAAWEVNRKLPKDARRFRIIGINMDDKREYWLPSESHREKNRARNMEIGGHFYDVVNKFWAKVIWKEFISRNEKALIWAGACHTPTRFRIDRRPRLEHYISAGNLIYNFIDERAMYIALHSASCYGDLEMAPVSDFIEAIMQKVPGAEKGAGFDTAGTPLGDLSLPDEIKGWSGGKITDFKLSDLCDGYCYLVPRSEFKPDTPMDFKQ